MSRRIGVDNDTGYRTVTVYTNWDGERRTRVEGIYDHIGAARGRVTFWRGYNPAAFIEGWVEQATITWAPVEGSLVENEGTNEERGDQDEG